MRLTKIVAAVALAAFLPLAGCGQGATAEQPSSAPSVTATPKPAPFDATVKHLLKVERANPDKVATAFATLITSWDVARDKTETGAAIRARPLMTPALAARTVEPERNASQALWLELGPLGCVLRTDHRTRRTGRRRRRNRHRRDRIPELHRHMGLARRRRQAPESRSAEAKHLPGPDPDQRGMVRGRLRHRRPPRPDDDERPQRGPAYSPGGPATIPPSCRSSVSSPVFARGIEAIVDGYR
jgi:hypothetical protein